MTVGQLIRAALAGGMDPVDARILVAHALSWDRIALITRADDRLTASQAADAFSLLQRRLAGEPVAYLTGVREFYGLPLSVTPDVLIPRPETELLVDLALERIPADGPEMRVLDLGTGSGAIAVAIAHHRPKVIVTAVDASTAALEVARRNARRHATKGAEVVFFQSDWTGALGKARYHLIVSNPPYIAAGDRHLAEGDLRYEPVDALTDHADGLDAIRTIVRDAAAYLEPEGWLLIEHGYDQSGAVRRIMERAGYSAVQSWRDLAGIERASGGQWQEGLLAESATSARIGKS